MMLTFISHQWKSFWRSQNTGKSIVVRSVMSILVLYLLLNLLFISFFLDTILIKFFPEPDVIEIFNGFLLYYFLLDLWMRYQFQELPTLSVQPYLHLPVKRNQIVSYLCFTSLWSGFTFAPFVLTIPFLIKVLLPEHNAFVFAGFAGTIAGLTLFNHFFIIWLKRKENINSWFMILFLAIIIGIAFMDFSWHIISISHYSSLLFNAVIIHPVYAIAVLFIGILMYFINYSYLKSNLYLEELYANSKSVKSATEFPLLNRFGKAGDLAANELKLIFRNKRPKATVLKGAIILFYGLIFYQNPKLSGSFMALMFCPMLMTGMFIINYGQFMFSWQSAHFDGILVNKISIRDFFRSKFLLFTLFSSLAFIITIPYVYFGWRILMMHAIFYLWNIGVNSLMVLYFANFNYKRIDLSKGASFNWEGMGATQWILSIPLVLTPYIIYLPFNWLGYTNIGIALIGAIGTICILTRELWIKILINNFNANRYKIAEGFRNE